MSDALLIQVREPLFKPPLCHTIGKDSKNSKGVGQKDKQVNRILGGA
jgi:hypothetical protein